MSELTWENLERGMEGVGLGEKKPVAEKRKELRIVLPGRPTTKKNSGQIAHRGSAHIILPSKPYLKYENECLWRLARYKDQAFDMPVHIKCLYWLPDKAHYPDLVGLMQATADILEKAKILADDRLINDWDGTHIAGFDKANPRAEIEIIELDTDLENAIDPYVRKKIIAMTTQQLF